MGKVAVAAVLAFGFGAFSTTLFGGVLGTQAEAAALGVAGLGLFGAGQLFAARAAAGSRAEQLREETLKETLGVRAKVPA